MTLFLIVLVLAPVAYWIYRRSAKSSNGAVASERRRPDSVSPSSFVPDAVMTSRKELSGVPNERLEDGKQELPTPVTHGSELQEICCTDEVGESGESRGTVGAGTAVSDGENDLAHEAAPDRPGAAEVAALTSEQEVVEAEHQEIERPLSGEHGVAYLRSPIDYEETQTVETGKEVERGGTEANPSFDEPGEFPAGVGSKEGLEEEIEQQPGSAEGDREVPLQRYRPPTQRPPRSPSERVRSDRQDTRAISGAALDVFVHLTFDRASYCTLQLLPSRAPELNEDLDVKSGGECWRLLAEEDWYQDIVPADMAKTLLSGIGLKGVLASGREVRWLLKGRDIYVLAGHSRAYGYLSTPRLLLGRSDVVICVEELSAAVESLLEAAGCAGYKKLGIPLGLPRGWTGFRDVLPTKPLPLESGVDPLYALKPAADIEIGLEGGICIRNSAWLSGFPPQIKVYGEIGGSKILIDGKDVLVNADGALTSEGYDTVGEHIVYIESHSRSRSYSIEAPPDSWDQWAAFQFRGRSICGPLTQSSAEAAIKAPVVVPMSNPVLLGAKPGEIFHCSSRRVGKWKGFVPFNVVWALPAQPLTSNKKIARIIQFADTPLAPLDEKKQRVESWCNAILEASSKGLRIESAFSDSPSLWRKYKDAARNLRRMKR